jgi:hypothetical protein
MQQVLALIRKNKKKKFKKEVKLSSKRLQTRELSSFLDLPVQKYSRCSIEMSPRLFSTSDQPVVRLILSHTELHKLFMAHAKFEFSDESVKCWEAVQRYRKAKDYGERQQVAHYIYNLFLAPDAQADVNIKESTKLAIWEHIDEGELLDHLFDQVELEVEENLADIFARFSSTQEYLEFMENHTPRKVEETPRPPSESSNDSITPRPMSISPRIWLCGIKM